MKFSKIQKINSLRITFYQKLFASLIYRNVRPHLSPKKNCEYVFVCIHFLKIIITKVQFSVHAQETSICNSKFPYIARTCIYVQQNLVKIIESICNFSFTYFKQLKLKVLLKIFFIFGSLHLYFRCFL